MPATIDFFFDFVSPYAYLAHTQLPTLAKRCGVSMTYHVIDLQQAKHAVGNTGPSNREMPIKHRYLRQDLQRWASDYGVPFSPPAGYGSTRLNCGVFYALDRGEVQRYVDLVWRRVWSEGGAMNDDGLIADVASEMGWQADHFLEFIVSREAIDRLHASNASALRRGVFGVPTMLVGDDMWWGNDRLHFLERHLQIFKQILLDQASA
jgi:2-hydroxychromene-2-carboxylate isomerase